MLGRLGDDSIVTMGANSAKLDYEAAWRRELGRCCPPKQRSATGGSDEWCSDVPVIAFVVSVRNAAAPAGEGLLRPLIRRWQAGGCAAATFRLPVVQAVVDWKWGFVRRVLIAELLLFLLWLGAFFVFVWAHRVRRHGCIPKWVTCRCCLLCSAAAAATPPCPTPLQVEDAGVTLHELLATPRGRLAVAAELVAAAAMLPFLMIDACTAAAYRWQFVYSWHLLSLATYALQVRMHWRCILAGSWQRELAKQANSCMCTCDI